VAFVTPALGHSWRSFVIPLSHFLDADVYDLFRVPSTSVEYDVAYYVVDAVTLVRNLDNALSVKAKRRIAWIDVEGLPLEDVTELNRHFKVYTASHYARSLLEKVGVNVKGVIPRPLVPIQNKQVYREWKRRFREKYGVYVSFVGMNNIRKGLRELEEIARILEEYGLNTVAWTSMDYQSKHVKTVGWFGLSSKDTVYAFMSASVCYCGVNRVEGFGMPLLEAMYLKVPVVYNNAPAHNEFTIGYPVEPERTEKVRAMGYEYTLYIPDSERMAERILECIGDEDKDLVVDTAFRHSLVFNMGNVTLKLIATCTED